MFTSSISLHLRMLKIVHVAQINCGHLNCWSTLVGTGIFPPLGMYTLTITQNKREHVSIYYTHCSASCYKVSVLDASCLPCSNTHENADTFFFTLSYYLTAALEVASNPLAQFASSAVLGSQMFCCDGVLSWQQGSCSQVHILLENGSVRIYAKTETSPPRVCVKTVRINQKKKKS